MSVQLETAMEVYTRVLAHLLAQIRIAAIRDDPFSHMYLEDVFPADIYVALLAYLPHFNKYCSGPRNPNKRPCVRTFYNLTADRVESFSVDCRNLWRGVAAALTEPELKRYLYAKLATDLGHRYGVDEEHVPDLPGHPRPTLYREVEGYEIRPHPDTLKKVVTMHIYLPIDNSQIHLGTALYQRNRDPLSKTDWQENFTIVRQFEFRPNSGYAFVVNNSVSRQSWHGCDLLPAGAGIRNTLLNTFYAEFRHGYSRYLVEEADTLQRQPLCVLQWLPKGINTAYTNRCAGWQGCAYWPPRTIHSG